MRVKGGNCVANANAVVGGGVRGNASLDTIGIVSENNAHLTHGVGGVLAGITLPRYGSFSATRTCCSVQLVR